MKFYFLLWSLFIVFSTAHAQTQMSGVKVTTRRLGEETIVKDSTGAIYPFAIWSKLVSSGDYNIRRENPRSDSSAYILYAMSEDQKDKLMAKRPRPAESAQFTPGNIFKPFKEKSMDGFKYDPKLAAGKVLVLNFWFIGCPPCREEIPGLNKLVKKYKNNPDVIFVAVALDESYEIKNYMKVNPLDYHIIDNGRYIADKYGVHLYPTNVVIDRNNKILYSSQGGSSANTYWMKKMIDNALAEPANKLAAQ